MPFLGAIAGVAQAGAGIAGAAAAQGDKDKAAAAQAAVIKQLESVGIPSVEAQKIALQNPQFVAQYAPQLLTAEQQGQGKMEQVSTDPRLALAQMQALDKLQSLSTEGLSPEETAQLKDLQRQAQARGQAKQGQIMQSMQERGMGGAGAELAQRLAASQEATQAEAKGGEDIAAQAHARALQALTSGAGLAGQVRGQEFGEEAQKASAADEIARFNLLQRMGVQQQNVQAQNIAGMRQADIQQQLEAQRAATANQQEMYNKALQQQQFQNQMAKAQGLASANQQAAQQYSQQAGATAQNIANIGAGIGQSIMGAGQAAQSQANTDRYFNMMEKAQQPAAPAAAPAAPAAPAAGPSLGNFQLSPGATLKKYIQ